MTRITRIYADQIRAIRVTRVESLVALEIQDSLEKTSISKRQISNKLQRTIAKQLPNTEEFHTDDPDNTDLCRSGSAIRVTRVESLIALEIQDSLEKTSISKRQISNKLQRTIAKQLPNTEEFHTDDAGVTRVESLIALEIQDLT